MEKLTYIEEQELERLEDEQYYLNQKEIWYQEMLVDLETLENTDDQNRYTV